MYIKNIRIKNIRTIDEIKISFNPPFNGWHVILGDNGSGKSTLIRSISLALVGPVEAIALRTNWKDWLGWQSSTGFIRLDILKHPECDKYIGKSGPLKNWYIPNFFSFKREKNEVTTTNNYNIKKTKASTLVDAARFNWGKGAGWFSAGYGPFRRFTGGNSDRNKIYYSSPKAGAHLSVFGEDIALTEALEWLKELDYRRLKERENSNGVNESETILNNIKYFINNSKLLPHEALFERIDELPVFKDGLGNFIQVTELSDGYRSILSLTFELIRQLIICYGQEIVFSNIKKSNTINVKGVVLIDEIDAHLHPTWQTRIGSWFTTQFPELQFIVTSHSPLICRASSKGSIWRLKSPGANMSSGEVTELEKEKLIYGNILDAYGTEIFGKSPVRSNISEEKLERLGNLNMLFALGKITTEENKERLDLQKIFSTDDSITL